MIACLVETTNYSHFCFPILRQANNGLSRPAWIICLSLHDFAIENSAFDIKDGQAILSHLINGMAGQVILTAECGTPYSFEESS